MAENEADKVEGMADGDAKLETKPAPQAQDPPLPREELVAKLDQLSARAREAGLSPLRMMAEAYAKRGLAVLDSLLGALEEPKKAEPPDTPAKKKA